MPRLWHDRHAVNKIEDGDEKELYRRIVADKKPYFMRYIYPDLMKQYNTYIKNTNRNALREFQMTVGELMAIPEDKRSDRQNEFLRYYEYRMPVGLGECVMNKICKRFEREFDGYVSRKNRGGQFDYSFMLSDSEYSIRQFRDIKLLYEDYNSRLRSYAVLSSKERTDEIQGAAAYEFMNEEFKKKCISVCPDKYALCNIILDLCYSKTSSKRFAWNMCGDEIIHTLLEKKEYIIHFPMKNEDGDIEFGGESFGIEEFKLEENE